MRNYAIIRTSTGLVENMVAWDGSDDWAAPVGFEAIEADAAGIGWTYAGGKFTAPEPPPVPSPSSAETLAANTGLRDALLAQATLAIGPLQDAVDLGIATDDETAHLKAWKQYRVAVNRVDLTVDLPTWPAQPA